MKSIQYSRFLLLASLFIATNTLPARTISLNGIWEAGENRHYTKKMKVPGLASDPSQMNEGTFWFKRKIQLPDGDWTHATIILKGALFSPAVYVNGVKVSQQNGGMAPTYHLLKHDAIKPNNKITIEIALQSLRDIPESDASYVPRANHWRSNISALIWDDIVLKTYSKFRISRIIPFTDIQKDQVKVKWALEKVIKNGEMPDEISCEIIDPKGKILTKSQKSINSLTGTIIVPFENKCNLWSPENPNLYRLSLTIKNNARVLDTETISYGIKKFSTEGIEFRLNGNPYKVRAGTVVWHRWIRDPEAKYIAFDQTWFEENIVQRLKDHGANTLRLHLGNPPEAFLDLCDEYGLLVQYEWSFFHGMPASEESLIEQWRNWLDLAMRHPSVALIHPYNETHGNELNVAWSALDTLIKEYPPLVLEERDVIHIHKYWWSMFENVGLYYDSAEEFPKPIMVDEFGGNYLDGYGNPGGYRTLKATFLRFCGRRHTPAMRSYHHTISNSQIAEYWRRIGAAGFSPFCIVGSWEDGNHWYLGQLKNGMPKEVWGALTASFSPISVSLEIWDRNFTPGQTVEIPLYFFNDTENRMTLNVILFIEDESGVRIGEKSIQKECPPFQKKVQRFSFKLPDEYGRYTFKANLQNPPQTVKHPVITRWDFRILKPIVPTNIQTAKIGILNEERELNAFLSNQELSIVDIENNDADIIIGSRKTWEKIAASPEMRKNMYQSIQTGKSIVLMDAGLQYLGQGYSKDPEVRYGFIQTSSKIRDPEVEEIELFGGVKLKFTTIGEPESHIHPSKEKTDLWFNLEQDYTWLWNGMRGGLIAPAADMEFSGISPAAFISQWQSRGANESMFMGDNYYAYDLNGFYAYSTENDDKAVMRALRNRVQFLVEDAPALAPSLNSSAEINIINLIDLYMKSRAGKAEKLVPLVNCGPNLSRAPVVRIDFGNNKGSVIISQLITEGRLAPGYGEQGLYGKRYDAVAVQFVLNLLNEVIDN